MILLLIKDTLNALAEGFTELIANKITRLNFVSNQFLFAFEGTK
jgi:hypothetical protein